MVMRILLFCYNITEVVSDFFFVHNIFSCRIGQQHKTSTLSPSKSISIQRTYYEFIEYSVLRLSYKIGSLRHFGKTIKWKRNNPKAPPKLVSSMEALLCAFWILRVPWDFVRFISGCGLFCFVLVGLRHTPFICCVNRKEREKGKMQLLVQQRNHSLGDDHLGVARCVRDAIHDWFPNTKHFITRLK